MSGKGCSSLICCQRKGSLFAGFLLKWRSDKSLYPISLLGSEMPEEWNLVEIDGAVIDLPLWVYGETRHVYSRGIVQDRTESNITPAFPSQRTIARAHLGNTSCDIFLGLIADAIWVRFLRGIARAPFARTECQAAFIGTLTSQFPTREFQKFVTSADEGSISDFWKRIAENVSGTIPPELGNGFPSWKQKNVPKGNLLIVCNSLCRTALKQKV